MEEGTFEEHLPEQMEFFCREILPPLAVRAFFKGVGKLDQEGAHTILSEMGKVCGGFALASMAARGLEIPTADVDAFLEAHAKGENVASGGQSMLARDGNTTTFVIKGAVCARWSRLSRLSRPPTTACARSTT